MVASRKGRKNNEQEIPNRIEHNDDDDDEEYDEEKGAQLLQKIIASVLKPKSKHVNPSFMFFHCTSLGSLSSDDIPSSINGSYKSQ
ncbi:unnamed protein product [Rotaria sp. Silwood1]|nr:unnamed protein product [Rotaria sp. Silwood1]CAF1690404.1 unnamed protein product [Rotaria sp. Silwood1]CAF3772573.1 unnamed protein product [Rotaria sp. Silwood1]CAF3928313.1 unnamed protein product [Rotaria sp. Silwood1]CAF4045288.1 unnamed protein product [Rotaria sp. Silwood1]